MIDPAQRPQHVDVGQQDVENEVVETPTIIVFVLDASGSMAALIDPTISGFNEYLDGVSGNSQAQFVLTTLGGSVRRGTLQPIAQAQRLTRQNYRPDGGTPLYDAICETIEYLDQAALDLTVPIQFIILTDGENNQSARTREQTRLLIEAKTATQRWTFVYVGANQDAWAVSRDIGVAAGNTTAYTSNVASTGATFDSLRRMSTTRMTKSAGGQSASASTFADAGMDNTVLPENQTPTPTAATPREPTPTP